jgi:hypothetical protein
VTYPHRPLHQQKQILYHHRKTRHPFLQGPLIFASQVSDSRLL